MAEVWHADTFNIDAAVKQTHTRAFVPKSTDFASPDIVSSDGMQYSLKYDGSAYRSVVDQAKSYWKRYNADMARNRKNNIPDISFENYLHDRHLNIDEIDKFASIYNGQGRIVPREQLEDAIEIVKRKIAKEQGNRPELVAGYEETLRNLQDRLQSADGTESIPLSNKEAEELARLAKDGTLDVSKLGLTTEQLVKVQYIMQQALKAGLTSTVISMVLKLSPELYKTIDKLIKDGSVDKEQFKKLGFDAITGAGQGFVYGSISAALTTTCLSGILGSGLKQVDPSIIGTMTVVVMNTIVNAYKLSTKKMSSTEFANTLTKDLFVTSFSLAMGGVIQGITPVLPVLGYLLGSFIGSLGGSLLYDTGYQAFMSLCIDTGFTCFGLVSQDYKLPKELLEKIGIITFNAQIFQSNKLEYRSFKVKQFQYKKFEYATIGITPLKRGIIGINKIGYV